MNALHKGIIVVILCTTLLFLGLTCNNNAMTPNTPTSSQHDDNTQQNDGTPQITIWKDEEGVIHIENEPPAPSPQSSQNTSPVADTTASPHKKSEENALSSQKGEPPPQLAVSRPAKTERLQLQEQHNRLEHLFIRAKNKGNGYAQIRLRHLLDANDREQERLRSRVPASPNQP